VFRAVVGRRLTFALALAVLVVPRAAYANGDPASDVLLQAKIYFPTQRVSMEEAQKLHDVVNSANAKGYPIRVALIKDESDLGVVPNLLNQPQKYAEFLAPEIRFAYRGDLLVVMPDGLGVTQTDQTPAPAKAIDGMNVEAGGSPDGLAMTAEEAVAKLSAAAGHPLEGAKKGGSSSALAGILVAVALLGLGIGGALWLRHSQRPTAAAPAGTAASDSPGDS
jgi:hypothetical protein